MLGCRGCSSALISRITPPGGGSHAEPGDPRFCRLRPSLVRSLHPAERALDQQVAQLRSALTEMADRMQHLQRVLDAPAKAMTRSDVTD